MVSTGPDGMHRHASLRRAASSSPSRLEFPRRPVEHLVPMSRRLSNLRAATSLLVCVALLIGWVMSWREVDHLGGESAISAEGRQRGGGLSCACGTIELELWSR